MSNPAFKPIIPINITIDNTHIQKSETILLKKMKEMTYLFFILACVRLAPKMVNPNTPTSWFFPVIVTFLLTLAPVAYAVSWLIPSVRTIYDLSFYFSVSDPMLSTIFFKVCIKEHILVSISWKEALDCQK